jgi:tripartite-type tricarboxylate transporter receptor subunit TctC
VRSTGLDYEASIWWGLLAPRGLPPAISALLQAAIRDALSEPDIARVYEAEGARPSFASGAEFQAELARDITRFRDVAARANIRAE